MIIDKKIEGLTCDITGNFLDIYFDENNNSFSNIDKRTSTVNTSDLFDLPQATLSFKSNPMQSIDSKSNELNSQENQLNMESNSKMSRQSVKRALFVEKDEIDHEANLKLVRKQMEQLEKQDCEKWNFDFKNNCPIKSLNSRFEWFIGEPVLNKLNLNTASTVNSINCNTSCNNANKLNNIINCDKKSDSEIVSSSTSHIATRSLKRKININDYFQPAKKRLPHCLSKDSSATKTSDVLSPVHNSNIKSVKNVSDKQPIKSSLKRKCKKSRSSTTQSRRLKKSKSLEKVTKRQTTLKF